MTTKEYKQNLELFNFHKSALYEYINEWLEILNNENKCE